MNDYLQELFYRANSADYQSKRDVFYPLKCELLRQYGSFDGWDLQIIQKDCWTCWGTGTDNWTFDDDATCEDCGGTGIYSTRYVKLDRYQLGDRLYHLPQPPPCPTQGYENRIEGLVKHSSAINSEEGELACQLLLDWCKKPLLADSDGVCRAVILGGSDARKVFDVDGVCRAAVLGGRDLFKIE